MKLERPSDSAAHWTEQQYRDLLAPGEGGVRHLVLVDQSEADSPSSPGAALLGFLVACQVESEWELENIVVAAGARRTGIGRGLLDALLVEARRTNNSSVFLEVRESNVAARALYEESGFVQVGQRRAYYKSPVEDAVLYRWTPPKPFS